MDNVVLGGGTSFSGAYGAAIELARVDFRKFVALVFYELNPNGTALDWNWHLDVVCYEASRLLPNAVDPLRRLIINVPPRSLKSVIFSVALPAYMLGHYPYHRCITASYSSGLSEKFNRDLIRVLESDWYGVMFPETILVKRTGKELVTSENGSCNATSVGGTATGRGGHLLIADDLLNPAQARSLAERTTSNNFFLNTLMSRHDNPSTGVAVVVMQRLSENDLTGLLLEKNKDLPIDRRWRCVSFPAEFTEDVTYRTGDCEYKVRSGDLLHSSRLSRGILDAKLVELGSYEYAGQYLQRPAPLDSGIFKLDNLVRASYVPTIDVPLPFGTLSLVLSADTAIKTGIRNDFSAICLFAVTKTHYYLLEMVHEKLEYPQLLRRLVEISNQVRLTYGRGCDVVLIEDKASGQQLIQNLRQETSLPIVAIKALVDKVTRIAATSATIEANKVVLPAVTTELGVTPYFTPISRWLPLLMNEYQMFPNGKHDDMIDCISQFISWQNQRSSFCSPRIRRL